jgi:hypothetical protein
MEQQQGATISPCSASHGQKVSSRAPLKIARFGRIELKWFVVICDEKIDERDE